MLANLKPWHYFILTVSFSSFRILQKHHQLRPSSVSIVVSDFKNAIEINSYQIEYSLVNCWKCRFVSPLVSFAFIVLYKLSSNWWCMILLHRDVSCQENYCNRRKNRKQKRHYAVHFLLLNCLFWYNLWILM